jgi:hypothetical protein
METHFKQPQAHEPRKQFYLHRALLINTVGSHSESEGTHPTQRHPLKTWVWTHQTSSKTISQYANSHLLHSIDILQWNVNGLFTLIPKLDIVWRRYAPASLCLQETHVYPSRTASLSSYTSQWCDDLAGEMVALSSLVESIRCYVLMIHPSVAVQLVIHGSFDIHNLQCVSATSHHCYLGRSSGLAVPDLCSSFAGERLQCTVPSLGQCR